MFCGISAPISGSPAGTAAASDSGAAPLACASASIAVRSSAMSDLKFCVSSGAHPRGV